MLDIAHLFISSALAQTADAVSPPGGSGTSIQSTFIVMGLVFGVFYFLVIRPQQKQLKDQQRMVSALQRGDRVVTSGGVLGKFMRLEGNDVAIVEIADNVQVKVQRSYLSALPATPVAAPEEKKN